jgi:hypothetical protein
VAEFLKCTVSSRELYPEPICFIKGGIKPFSMMNNCEIVQLQIISIGSGGGVDNHFLWIIAKFQKKGFQNFEYYSFVTSKVYEHFILNKSTLHDAAP